MLKHLIPHFVGLLISISGAMHAAHAALPVGISGPWYNPVQSGHGLSVELLADDRAVVFWYVYDSTGRPIFLYVEGQVTGQRIVGTAYAPRGMRFGVFDPSALSKPVWGQVAIDFDDCTHATLRWSAQSDEYGTGSMPIQRLASLAGISCTLPAQRLPATGLYQGTLEYQSGNRGAWGVVDRQGKLWALESGMVPGPTFFGDRYGLVVTATPTQQTSAGVEVTTLSLANSWLRKLGRGENVGVGSWNLVNGISGRFSGSDPAGYLNLTGQHWIPAAEPGTRLLSPVTLALISGDYSALLGGQIFDLGVDISISGTGDVCFQYAVSSQCNFRGQLSLLEGDAGLIEFEMRDQDYPDTPVYRGRGWLTESGLGRRLVLVGDNGVFGMGMEAWRYAASNR